MLTFHSLPLEGNRARNCFRIEELFVRSWISQPNWIGFPGLQQRWSIFNSDVMSMFLAPTPVRPSVSSSHFRISILSASLSPHKALRRNCSGRHDGWHGNRHGGGHCGRHGVQHKIFFSSSSVQFWYFKLFYTCEFKGGTSSDTLTFFTGPRCLWGPVYGSRPL